MAIFPSGDWVNVGIGKFYDVVLLSRFLLYRIYKYDLSILVYHDNTILSQTAALDSTADAFVSSASITIAPALAYNVTIQVMPSAEAKVPEIMASSKFKIDLHEIEIFKTNKINIHFKRHALPLKNEWILEGSSEKLIEMPIEGSRFRLASAFNFSNRGEYINARYSQKFGRSFDKEFFCWKIRLSTLDGDLKLSSALHWSLSALEIDDKGVLLSKIDLKYHK